MNDDVTRIPLHNKAGEVIAHALIDTADAERVLAFGRWYFDTSNGYVASRRRGQGRQSRATRLHRFVLGLEPGNPLQADHINRDRLDNRRANLRGVSRTFNARNNSGKRSSTSQHRGVSWDTRCQRWIALAHVAGRSFFLGRFHDELEAAHVAREFRLANMPGAVD